MRRATVTEQVREYAKKQYIDPARRRGEPTAVIIAGEVHKALHLVNRVPLVCNALSSKGFLERNQLVLERREGPPSGLSTTVQFTYRLLGSNGLRGKSSALAPFLGLRGIGKRVFQSLGGGEAFIRAERDQFNSSQRGR